MRALPQLRSTGVVTGYVNVDIGRAVDCLFPGMGGGAQLPTDAPCAIPAPAADSGFYMQWVESTQAYFFGPTVASELAQIRQELALARGRTEEAFLVYLAQRSSDLEEMLLRNEKGGPLLTEGATRLLAALELPLLTRWEHFSAALQVLPA